MQRVTTRFFQDQTKPLHTCKVNDRVRDVRVNTEACTWPKSGLRVLTAPASAPAAGQSRASTAPWGGRGLLLTGEARRGAWQLGAVAIGLPQLVVSNGLRGPAGLVVRVLCCFGNEGERGAAYKTDPKKGTGERMTSVQTCCTIYI